MRTFLNLSLEDADPVDPTLGVAVDAGAAVDSAETALVDVNEGAAEIAAVDTGLAQAEGAADALEEMAEGLQGVVESGGLTPEAANVVDIAVEAFCTQLGMSVKKLPSMEHYGNASSRVQATKLAMESIGETAKAAWEAIKKYIKKIADWIMAQYNKVFGGAEKLQARAKKLQARADADLPGTPKEATIENASVAEGLHVGGKVANVATNIAGVSDDVKVMFGKAFDETEKNIEDSVSSLEKIAADGDISVFQSGVGFATNVTAKDPKTVGYNEVKSPNVKFGTSDEMPGGKAIVSYFITTSANGKEGVDAVREASMKIDVANKAKDKAKVEAKFATINPSDCGKALEAVVAISGELKAFRNKQAKLKTTIDKANKAADTLSKKAQSETEKAKVDAYNLSGKALTALVRQATEFQYSGAVYALNVSKSTLDAVELSLKQYEAAKA